MIIFRTAAVILMFAFGIGVYLYLGHGAEQKVKPTVNAPSNIKMYPALSGTMYLVQGGALYEFRDGQFSRLTDAQGWTQPSLMPDGSGLLISRIQRGAYSDIYRMDTNGKVVAQLTNNVAPPSAGNDTSAFSWALYPKASPDGSTVFFDYDEPKGGYQVDLSVWAMPVAGDVHRARLWDPATPYSGGNVQPLPLSTGMIDVEYDLDNNGHPYGQLWFIPRAQGYGSPLTKPEDDCSQPAISPDGKMLAMVCSGQGQQQNLVVAPFDGHAMGTPVTLISDQFVSQPSWAPDGSGIAYLAPGGANQPFQLWFLPKGAYAPPSPVPTPSPGSSPAPSPVPVHAERITQDLGFDATSSLAWAK